MDDWIACLGVKALGLCRYDPLKPHAVYFSVGEAIGALAFLLAFTQLVTPGLKFRLRVHNRRAWVAFLLFIAAFACVVVAALIPAVLGYVIPVVGFPIFWEVVGGALVLVGAGVLAQTYYFGRALFSEASCERFFYACHRIVMRGDPVALQALAEEIPFSANAIVAAAASAEPDSAQPGTAEAPRVASTMRDFAVLLLALFSDPRFCRVMVDSAPSTAMTFIDALANPRGLTRPGNAFVKQLVQQSFLSDNSMLHREEDYVGLGHFMSFTRQVFGNYAFVAGPYRPLEAWHGWDEKYAGNEVLEKYTRALNTSLEAYFAHGDFGQYPSAISVGVDQLAEAVTYRTLDSGESGVPYSSSGVAAVATVEQTLTGLVRMLETNAPRLPQYQFEAGAYDKFKDVSIYGVAASGIFKFLETLATKYGNDERVRDLAIGLWMEVDPTPIQRVSPAIAEIQKRLLVHLIKKLNDNLDKGYYPMVVRVLLLLIGVWDSQTKDPTTLGFATAELHRQLCEKYYAAYIADPEKAARMLPAGVTFDASASELVSINKYTKTETRLSLQRPQA